LSKSARPIDHCVRRDVDPARGDEALLDDAVLRDRDAGGVRTHAAMFREEGERGGRHVLELGRGRAAPSREFGEGGTVQVLGGDVVVCDRAGRTVRPRVQHAHPVAQRLRRHAEHAAELPSTEQTEPGARRDGLAGHS
jgi:hypothetical protein